MAFREEKNFANKHKHKVIPDPLIKENVLERAKDGEISCAVAFEVEKELQVSSDKVGITIDLLNIKLIKCQMGLFGYKPQKKIVKPENMENPDLKDAITDALVEGRLSCKSAWEISSRLDVPKLTLSKACEFWGIKINNCQLGAF